MRATIQTKLLGSALFLLACLAVVGIVGIASLSSVAQKGEVMDANVVQPLNDLAVARAKLNENRAFTLRHILESDDADRAELQQQLDANSKLTDEALDRVRKTIITEEGRQIDAALTAARERNSAVRDEILALSEQDRDEEAYALQKGEGVAAFEAVAAAFGKLQDSKMAVADAQSDAITSTYTSRRTLSIALIVIAILAGLGVSLWISRGIRRGVADVNDRLGSVRDASTNLRDALGAMAKGDLRAEARAEVAPIERISGDEIGEVAKSVNAVGENTVASAEAYNATRASLASMLSQVNSTAGHVSSASQEVASTSEEAGRAVTEIATAVGEVASGSEQQVRMIEGARASAQDTATAADTAREVADEGARAAEEATEAMSAVRSSSAEVTSAIRALADKSSEISGIVETIGGIAEQTNLLALNAAIEAARAGDQGRGFAVVADEVRKLAEESQQAAGSIAGLIGEIQTETDHAVTVVESGAERSDEGAAIVAQAKASFEKIADAVRDVSTRVGEIAHATTEVAAVAEESSASTEQVSASTQETSASTQQIAASAQELARSAEELEKLVGQFTLA
ncbi:MAG TPA: methyl-accepting chemotaxis protein [Capillimicrobium sp.]